MRDPENCIRGRKKSDTVVAGNYIAQHDSGGGVAGRRDRYDAPIAVVRSLAIDDGLEACPGRKRANHDDSVEIIIFRRDFAEHTLDERRSGGFDKSPVSAVIGINRIRHRESARSFGRDTDPNSRKIPDDAVLDGEVSAGVEQ